MSQTGLSLVYRSLTGRPGKQRLYFIINVDNSRFKSIEGLVPAAYLDVIASNGGTLPLLPKSTSEVC